MQDMIQDPEAEGQYLFDKYPEDPCELCPKCLTYSVSRARDAWVCGNIYCGNTWSALEPAFEIVEP